VPHAGRLERNIWMAITNPPATGKDAAGDPEGGLEHEQKA
jgi:hypothetical protein